MSNKNEILNLLPGYCRGELSLEDTARVDKWILESAENRAIAEQYFRLEGMATMVDAYDAVDAKAALVKTRRRINARAFKRVFGTIRNVAACLLLPAAFAFGFYAWKTVQASSKEIVVTTSTGVTTALTLSDGTKVWLNANSKLTYPQKFHGSKREVTLEGEGNFQVTHKGSRRFVVNARDVQVTVYGTEFNVEAYSEHDGEIRTSLYKGSIALTFNDASGKAHSVMVKPGEDYIYNQQTHQMIRRAAKFAQDTSWKDGRILLDNTSLSDALRLIGNHYNVDFLIRRPELLENRYTGSFAGQRLEVVLGFIEKTSDIHFDMDYVDAGETAAVSGRQVILVK